MRPGIGECKCGNAHRTAAIVAVVIDRFARRRALGRQRQAAVTGDERALGIVDHVIDAVVLVGLEHVERGARQIDAQLAVGDAGLPADVERGVEQRVIVGERREIERVVIRHHRTDQRHQHDRRQQRNQQLRRSVAFAGLRAAACSLTMVLTRLSRAGSRARGWCGSRHRRVRVSCAAGARRLRSRCCRLRRPSRRAVRRAAPC